VEGKCWFWWDKLDWLMRQDTRRTVQLVSGDQQFQSTWTNEESRFLAFEQASQWLKGFSPEESERVLAGYGMLCQLEVPPEAPSEYRVLSWPELNVLERQGVRIGAHSMTHPVLSRCDERRVAWEITESIRALNGHIQAPLGVFCYPNGQQFDHGTREWKILAQTGIQYAMTTNGGVLPTSFAVDTDPYQRYRLPRISYQSDAGRIIRDFVS
jgi:peptidoglycan/xylan/chitin deacetylase (PgdA/CDA1 family)